MSKIKKVKVNNVEYDIGADYSNIDNIPNNIVRDSNYVHTDNNFDDTSKGNLILSTNRSHIHNNKGVLDGIQSTDITNWNNKLDTSKVKNVNSTVAGDVYDVTYINTMLGDIETLLGGI